MNFLKKFVEYNEGTEVPPMFALWCGLAGLSSVYSRRVWINMGRFRLFPNMYIVLVAPSARSRKSTAISMIEGMVRATQPSPNVIANCITPEALIDAMRLTPMAGSKGTIAEPRAICDGFIFADELVTFLNPTSYERGLASNLLTFFDCHDHYKYHTKSGGEQELQNICLGLLAGTTSNLLSEAIPEKAVGHGITSRIIFVYCDQKMEPIPWPESNEEGLKALVEYLNQAMTTEGEMNYSPKAKVLIADIYKTFYKTSPMYEDKYLSGYAGRRNVHLIKIAALLALGDEHGLIVQEEHVYGAEDILKRTEERMSVVMELVTSTKTGDILGLLRDILRGAKRLSRIELLRKFAHRITSKEMDLYVDTLKQSGDIVEVSSGGTTFYEWSRQ